MATDAPALKVLWAPWRTEFLHGPKPHGCIFCKAKRLKSADPAHHVLARGRHAFALLNRYPYNNGHFMVAPYRHVGDLARMRPDEWAETHTLATRLIASMRRLMHPAGFNLGINVGRTAGAGIPGHLHLHVVPRWHGDTNFMTVTGGMKVMSQSLDALYALLTQRKAARV